MASTSLFRTIAGKLLPKASTTNRAAGRAYALTPRHALAQYAATGCLNATFYASADDQLETVLGLANDVDPSFVAKTALYCRERAFMKDMPALLCAVLAVRNPALCAAIFPRVIDDGKMLRNFVQIVRSGATGRKSLGTRPKRLVTEWLTARTEEELFRASVGQSPSLADVVKMVHPKPTTEARRAFYGYLLERGHDAALLPDSVSAYEALKAGRTADVPNVPFQMLTMLPLTPEQWGAIAKNASWTMTRMNLNTFARHGVFEDPAMVSLVAGRLRNPDAIRKARAFPYQLLAAYLAAGSDVPGNIREALQDAMEVATSNVPAIEGKVYILVDVSGSMSSAVTGARKGSTSVVRCVDVAGLFAATLLRKNPSAEVIPFAQDVVTGLALNPRDSVMTNANTLASVGGGGTNCSAPLTFLNSRKAKGDFVIFVSDNESSMDPAKQRTTATMIEWNAFQGRNPRARLACLDLVPNATTQAPDRDDILNIGGFSDAVFDLLATFAKKEMSADHWVSEIEKIAV